VIEDQRVGNVGHTNIDSFVTVALFGGVGLLLSLSVLILNQYIPGEWFWRSQQKPADGTGKLSVDLDPT
jgi:hypothetical protein